jgi:hypothetical protein
MEAFAMLNGITAAFVLQEQADSTLQARNLRYLQHALASGDYPRLAELTSEADQFPQPSLETQIDTADRYPDLMARILTGVLGPALGCRRAAGHGQPRSRTR